MSINDIPIDENNERERERERDRERERERERERQRHFTHAMSFLLPFTTQSGRVQSNIHALVFSSKFDVPFKICYPAMEQFPMK